MTASTSTPPTELRAANGRAVALVVWRLHRGLASAIMGWAAAKAILPPLVSLTLGNAIGHVPGAVRSGLSSAAGRSLLLALAEAAVPFTLSLLLNPTGVALAHVTSSRMRNVLQATTARATSRPVGVAHLDASEAQALRATVAGSLTGYFPGDAPVTWAGLVATRFSGVLACAYVCTYRWWYGLVLIGLWTGARRITLPVMVSAGQHVKLGFADMRRAWYFAQAGTTPRDAKEIRVFGLSQFLAERFRMWQTRGIAPAAETARALRGRAGACWAAVIGVYATGLLMVTTDARDQVIDLRTFATVLTMLAVTVSAGTVSAEDVTLRWMLAGWPDVDAVMTQLGQDTEILNGTRTVDGTLPGSITFERVGYRYPSRAAPALVGVELELVPGRSTALVGANGAGKSTLVSLLCRLRDPTEGRILVGGIDVRDLEPGGWQRRVALMQQDPVRYPMSAHDNIAMGSVDHLDDRAGVQAVAEAAGFEDVVATLPDGWDTLLSRDLTDGVELSGGQWQRLALARALFAVRHGAQLLVLDEPTSALDVQAEARFYERFLHLTRGLTTVVISHRFATVRRADSIVVLEHGAIVEQGSHEELMAAAGRYERMYRLQADRYDLSVGA